MVSPLRHGVVVTCKAPGCDRPHHAKGLCTTHYMRQQYRRRKAAAAVRSRDLAGRVADLRLALEAAACRIEQALIVLHHPEVGAAKGVTVADLLADADRILDDARNR